MLADPTLSRLKLLLLALFSPGVHSKARNWAKKEDSKVVIFDLKSVPPVEKIFCSFQLSLIVSSSLIWCSVPFDSSECQLILKTNSPRKSLKIEVKIYKNPEIKKKGEFWFFCLPTTRPGLRKPLKVLDRSVTKLLCATLFSKQTQFDKDRGSDWKCGGKFELDQKRTKKFLLMWWLLKVGKW